MIVPFPNQHSSNTNLGTSTFFTEATVSKSNTTFQSPLQVFVALDNMSLEDVRDFLLQLPPGSVDLKVGLDLILRYGVSVIEKLSKDFHCHILCDTKLHDIPQSVYNCIKTLAHLPIQFLTLHVSGGREMLLRAKDAQELFLPQTKILGSCYLTSLDTRDMMDLWNLPYEKKTLERFFYMAHSCGLEGLILSAKDLPWFIEFEKQQNQKFIKVCPGIRFSDEIANNKINDQKRYTTPQEALKNGADHMILGRSLTHTVYLQKRFYELIQLKLHTQPHLH